jgi:hypothetical protein
MIAKDALMSLRAALAVKRGLPRPDAVCSALQMQEMANCGAVVSNTLAQHQTMSNTR